MLELAPPHTATNERAEGRAWLLAGSAAFLAFALLPILALVLAALPGQPIRLLRNAMVQDALRLSLVTSAVSTVLCVLLGLPVAYLLARFPVRGREVIETLIDLPMTMPPVVAGVALLLALGPMGLLGKRLDAAGVRLPFTTIAVVIAQTFIAAPFFIRSARAGFEAVPVHLEHAAMTLGRNRWRTFWSITAPLAAPALLAGAVLSWARALSEFGATMVFAGNTRGITQTLPLAVIGAMEQADGLDLAVAVSVLSLFLTFAALIGVRLVTRRVARW